MHRCFSLRESCEGELDVEKGTWRNCNLCSLVRLQSAYALGIPDDFVNYFVKYFDKRSTLKKLPIKFLDLPSNRQKL